MFKPFDQFLRIYGAGGYCAHHFPIETKARQLSETQIDIQLETKHGLPCSKAFYTVLAGQIEDLTTAIGLPRPMVTITFRGQSVGRYRSAATTFPKIRNPKPMPPEVRTRSL
jgi:hypothetical protein